MSLFKWKVVPGDTLPFFFPQAPKKISQLERKKLQLLQQQRMDINLVKRRKNYYIVLPQHQTINMYQPASTASLWDFYHKENGAIVWWGNTHNTMQNVHIVIEHAVHIVIELPTGHNTQYSNALYSQHLLWPFREWMKILFENVPWDFSLYIHKTTEKCLRSY